MIVETERTDIGKSSLWATQTLETRAKAIDMPSNLTNSNNVMTNTNQLIAAVAIALVIAFLAGIGIGSGGKVPTHSPQNIKQTDTVYGRFGSVVKSLHH